MTTWKIFSLAAAILFYPTPMLAHPGLHYVGVVGASSAWRTSATVRHNSLPLNPVAGFEYFVGTVVIKDPVSSQYIQVGVGWSPAWEAQYRLRERKRTALFYSTREGAEVVATVPLGVQVSIAIEKYQQGHQLAYISASWFTLSGGGGWNNYFRTVYVPGWDAAQGLPLVHVEAYASPVRHPRASFTFTTSLVPWTNPWARLQSQYPYGFTYGSTIQAFTVKKQITGEIE